MTSDLQMQFFLDTMSQSEIERLFYSGIACALSCLEQDNLVLKTKQLHAIKAIYEGRDDFLWLWEICMLLSTTVVV